MVDFTTLHPFDFDRNLFNFFAYSTGKAGRGKLTASKPRSKLKMKTLCLLLIAVLFGMYYSVTRQHNLFSRLWIIIYNVVII